MLRNTTRRKRPCPEQDEAALPPGPTNGPARLAREVSAPAASLTRGITPQADSSGSTSASPSPASAPVAHGRKKRRGHAQRDERSACDAAQLIARNDATSRRARFRCAAKKTTAKRGTGQTTGEGEVSLLAPSKHDASQRVAPYDEAVHSDVSALVDAIFRVANPMSVSVRLLASGDERIVEKHINQLYQMRYGKPGTASGDPDKPPIIVFDMPGPDDSDAT